MSWCFAIVNNRLAEIFFNDKDRQIFSHCYVKMSEYKTKKEKGRIRQDTAKVSLTYRDGKYAKKI